MMNFVQMLQEFQKIVFIDMNSSTVLTQNYQITEPISGLTQRYQTRPLKNF